MRPGVPAPTHAADMICEKPLCQSIGGTEAPKRCRFCRSPNAGGVTPLQGLGMGLGRPTPGLCSPGYHILPLQGSPREHTTHPRMERGTAQVAYIKGSVLTIDSWDLAQISPGTREPASAPTTSSITVHECALLFVLPQITLGRLRLFCLAQAAR